VSARPAVARLQSLIESSRLREALAEGQRALRSSPADPTLHLLLAAAHDRLVNRPQALYYAEKALALAGPSPGPNFLCEAGLVFLHGDHPDQSRRAFEAAARADPALPRPLLGLVSLAVAERRYATAADLARRALGLAPTDRDAAAAAAGCLLELGRADEALSILRPRASTGDLSLLSQLCCTLNYTGDDPGETLALVARRFGPPAPRPPIADPDPGRRLALGLVSPDLVGHSVARFVAPLLEHLDRDRFRVVCYSTIVPSPGDERRRPRCDLWRDVPFLNASDLARQVREDRIDVLVDLSGHTAGHRLATFQLHPAPVQITYLGYPASTGLACFDARLVDSTTDPPGTRASEPLVRLDPCFVSFPMTPPAPASPEGPFTFASFNALSKLGDAALSAWARILIRAPASRLLLKAFALAEEEVRAHVRARFASAGVDPARVEMLAWTPSADEHRALYRRVHLALDTFPYHGTTTTCEALSMGVPVLTLEGERHAGRAGASLLRAAGLPELVAPTVDDYVDAAARLAHPPGPPAIAERIARSALGDSTRFARQFESAIRDLWRSAIKRGG